MTPTWQSDCGTVSLYLADARAVLPGLDDSSIELVITDPPYSSGARRDAERQVRGSMLRSMDDEDWFSHDAMTAWGFSWFFRSVLTDMRRTLARGAHVYVFIDWRQTPNVYGMLEASGYRVNQCLVWAKTHFGMGSYWRNQHENIVFASNGQPLGMLDRGMGSVLVAQQVPSDDREHPTEKPIELVNRIVTAIPGNVVFDPFMGSGTTGVAAVRNDRSFVGVEIDERHFFTAKRRITEALNSQPLFAGQTAPIQKELLECR